MFNLNSLYMNDLIIMAAMLAVFGIWLLFRRLKKRRSADDDPGGKDFTLTREQVEELNRQRAEKEIVLPSAPAEENRSVSEPSAAEPVMEKLSAPAGGREKQSEELTEADLWNQWVARTGDYRLSKDAIAAAAGHLTPEQALTLCKRYREQHPQLYAGIRKYADWYERSEPAGKNHRPAYGGADEAGRHYPSPLILQNKRDSRLKARLSFFCLDSRRGMWYIARNQLRL